MEEAKDLVAAKDQIQEALKTFWEGNEFLRDYYLHFQPGVAKSRETCGIASIILENFEDETFCENALWATVSLRIRQCERIDSTLLLNEVLVKLKDEVKSQNFWVHDVHRGFDDIANGMITYDIYIKIRYFLQ